MPLFVEEMTKAVLESGALRETDTAWLLDGPLNAQAIPTSLHDSLMARLDRVPEVKAVAQMAACIGREFDAMVHRLTRVADIIREAAEDNAHAFKGPIAVIRQAVELLAARRKTSFMRLIGQFQRSQSNSASAWMVSLSNRATRSQSAERPMRCRCSGDPRELVPWAGFQTHTAF